MGGGCDNGVAGGEGFAVGEGELAGVDGGDLGSEPEGGFLQLVGQLLGNGLDAALGQEGEALAKEFEHKLKHPTGGL